MEFFAIKRKLGFLLLVFCLTSAEAFLHYTEIGDVETLVENSPTNPQIIRIGKGLLKAKCDIYLLNDSIERVSNGTVYQKLFIIRENLLRLREEIADQKTTKKHAIYKTSVDHLTMFYDFLCRRMFEVKKNINSLKKNSTASAVIKAIANFEFQEAENMLALIESKSTISRIVHKIYDCNPINTQILLNFTESLTTIGSSISMISAIHRELKACEHLDIFRILYLLRLTECEVFNQSNFNPKQHSHILNFHEDAVAFLKKNSTDIMVAKMLDHTFLYDSEILVYLSDLYDFNKQLSNDIFFKVIDKVYGKIRIDDIIDNIFIQFNIPLVSDAYIYIFQKMKALQQLEAGVIKLAIYIFKILNIEDVIKDLGEKRYKDLIFIWREFPASVKYLFSAKRICLKNAWKPEYLYAADENYDNRRKIFTWISGKIFTQGIWHVENELLSEDFYFVNEEYPNEYLTVSEHETVQKNIHSVFASKMKSKKSAWNLDVVGRNVRIYNASNNKTLCVASNPYDENSRNVITLEKNVYADTLICMWDLKIC